MPIRIDPNAEVPIHEQIRQQVIFGIATGEYPGGHVMPSAAQEARRLKIHKNTVLKAYGVLADQRWLVPQKGSEYVVVHPRSSLPDPKSEDIDLLLTRVLMASNAQGMRAGDVVERMQELLTSASSNHFLIVEPEPGIGNVLKYEVRQATGKKVVSTTIPELWERPELLTGAALLVPGYLADLLDFLPVGQRAKMIRLVYSPFGGYVDSVRKLTKPSVIGMISVSGPGMKTMDGVFAEAIGNRHRLIPFLLELPVSQNEKPVIRKIESEDLPPDIDIRVIGLRGSAARSAMRALPPPAGWASHLPIATDADFQAIDVLFTDSITFNFVRHPRKEMYRLLSDASLEDIQKFQLSEPKAPNSR